MRSVYDVSAIEDPAGHYDHITRAWRYLLGEDFHCGYFTAENEPLETATDNLTNLMAEKGSIGRDMPVLDVGCGIGNPACFLAERYSCRVTGISTSRAGIELANRRARERGCSDRVSFALADGMDNGLPDASFDRVWVLESSHLMPLKEGLLAECARVLRPGGHLVLCDIVLRRELPLAEVLCRAQDFVHLHYTFGRAKMESLETYGRFAERAGLQVSELLDISNQTLPTFGHWQRKLESSREDIRALIGDGGLEHFLASCEILPGFWKQRIFGYGLMAAVKK
jgi:27-O-demethylrifamycin SV methyltransferase